MVVKWGLPHKFLSLTIAVGQHMANIDSKTKFIYVWSESSLSTWQNQQNDCAPSKDSDQPGHPPCLIRVFAVCMKKAWVLSYPLSTQPLCWFCHEATQMLFSFTSNVMKKPVLCHMQTAKMQISLCIWAVWSGSLFVCSLDNIISTVYMLYRKFPYYTENFKILASVCRPVWVLPVANPADRFSHDVA